MARKPRIHIPGRVYHVMLRGNGGQDINDKGGGLGLIPSIRQKI